MNIIQKGQQFAIDNGPMLGVWQVMDTTGFGSRQTSARFQRLGKNGQPLRSPGTGINLTEDQVKRLIQHTTT